MSGRSDTGTPLPLPWPFLGRPRVPDKSQSNSNVPWLQIHVCTPKLALSWDVRCVVARSGRLSLLPVVSEFFCETGRLSAGSITSSFGYHHSIVAEFDWLLRKRKAYK